MAVEEVAMAEEAVDTVVSFFLSVLHFSRLELMAVVEVSRLPQQL